MYSLDYDVAPPLAPKRMRLGVPGRMNAAGVELAPLDEDGIIAAARKTGRVIILSEAITPGGSHHNVASLIAQHCYRDLKAAPQVIAPPAIPVPFHRDLEKAYLPNPDELVEAIKRAGVAVDDG